MENQISIFSSRLSHPEGQDCPIKSLLKNSPRDFHQIHKFTPTSANPRAHTSFTTNPQSSHQLHNQSTKSHQHSQEKNHQHSEIFNDKIKRKKGQSSLKQPVKKNIFIECVVFAVFFVFAIFLYIFCRTYIFNSCLNFSPLPKNVLFGALHFFSSLF